MTRKKTETQSSTWELDAEFQGLLDQLVKTMREELRQHLRFADAVRRRRSFRLGPGPNQMDSILRAEREAITGVVTMERDRIALVTELGQILGHPVPSRLRVAEILLHAAPENRDELLDLRDDFRDLADQLDDLVAVNPAFSRHRNENVCLYVTPSRSEACLAGLNGPEQRRPRGASSLSSRGDV